MPRHWLQPGRPLVSGASSTPGFLGYAIYQLLPAQRQGSRHAERHGQLRPWAALSAVLNAVWIAVVQAGVVWASVLIILGLLVVLVRMVMILRKTRTHTKTDALLTDGTFGLYLGWVCVATTANIAAWVATFGVHTFPGWQWAGVVIIAVVMIISVGLAVYSRGRIAPALAISWGLTWLAVARLEGSSNPRSSFGPHYLPRPWCWWRPSSFA